MRSAFQAKARHIIPPAFFIVSGREVPIISLEMTSEGMLTIFNGGELSVDPRRQRTVTIIFFTFRGHSILFIFHKFISAV